MKNEKEMEKLLEFGNGVVKEIKYSRFANEDIQNVNVSLNVMDIKKISGDEISLEYAYKAEYGKSTNLIIRGTLNFRGLRADKIATAWSETKKVPEPYGGKILSILYFLVSPLAISMSTLLGLPPASLPVDFSKGNSSN